MMQFSGLGLVLGSLLSLGGCAGVYAEVAASRLTSATFTPDGDGPEVDADGASSVGFNLGFDFGGTRRRFVMGYTQETLSFEGESSTGNAASFRYDFTLVQLAERLKLRLGLGLDFGGSSDGGLASALAGVGATYFLTWKNAIHVLVGARGTGQSMEGGSLVGTGPTVRIALTHSFGDMRPDQMIVVPLDFNENITGVIERGATALGCVTTSRLGSSTYAALEVVCPGHRHIAYLQISNGMMITCEREQSKGRCRKLSSSILDAATAKRTPEPAPTPDQPPTAVPASTSEQPPAPPALPDPAATPTSDGTGSAAPPSSESAPGEVTPPAP